MFSDIVLWEYRVNIILVNSMYMLVMAKKGAFIALDETSNRIELFTRSDLCTKNCNCFQVHEYIKTGNILS